MRSILITVMLIIAVIALYNATVGGNDGAKSKVANAGGRVNAQVQNINP